MRGMRKTAAGLVLSLALALWLTVPAFARPDWPSDTGVQSEAGIVMDVDSGTVLFGQNIHEQKAPASIVKILTALVVIENADLDGTVTFSHDAVYNVEDGSGNKNAIEEGDRLSVRDCLYLMLLRSSNQAANALAEHVGGSRDGFVEMMNAKADELGCMESHFANPSGLNDDTQLTSVYDMALISRAAYRNPTLLEISSSTSYRLPATINNPDGVTISAEHKLLITEDESSENYYPDAVAGKTGYTSIAGQTLVTYAERDGRRLISVTMRSTEATHYQDAIALLDFGFLRFKNVRIAENETEYTAGEEPVTLGTETFSPSDLSMDEEAVITLPADAAFSDAEKTVETDLGTDRPAGAVALLAYTYNERKIGQVYLISASRAAAEAAGSLPPAAGETAGESAPEGGAADPGAAGSDPAADDEFLPEAGSDQVTGVSLSAKSAVLAGAAVAAVALAAVGLILLKKKQEEERRRLEERRRRRRQRLEEIGCSEEEFEPLLRARTGQKKKR